MPITAEKNRVRDQLRSTLDSAFWGNEVASPNNATGVSRLLPCEPPPLSQTTFSGLSRLQQIFIAQRADIPVIPSFCGEQGGIVLDKVMLSVGQSNRWWATLTGRMRLQQAWTKPVDPDANGQPSMGQPASEGSNLAKLKDPDVYALSARGQVNLGPIKCQGNLDVGSLDHVPSLMRGEWPDRRPGPYGTSARVSLSTKVKGHMIKGVAAWNEPLLDSASSYSSAPRTLSFDLKSPSRPDGISYRLGVYQVEAPHSELAEVTAIYAPPPDLTQASESGESGPSRRPRVAYRKASHAQASALWEKHRYLWRAKPKNAGGRSKATGGASDGSEREGAAGISLSKLPNSVAAATGGIGTLISQIKSKTAPTTHEQPSSSSSTPSAAMKPASTAPPSPTSTSARTYAAQDAGSMSFERPPASTSKSTPELMPWKNVMNLFVDRPHLMVAGAVGGLLRVPLEGNTAAHHPSQVMRALSGSTMRPFASGAVSAQLGRFQRAFFDYTHVSARVDLGLTAPSTSQAALTDSADVYDGTERPTDFYASRNRAFALEGRGVTHAVSVSFAQQILGPVRGRVDLRFGLDSIPSAYPVNDRGFGWAIGGTIQHVQGLRPTLLDCVYGADVVLPNTGGAGKVCAWFSPMRREAMVEVRLLG